MKDVISVDTMLEEFFVILRAVVGDDLEAVKARNQFGSPPDELKTKLHSLLISKLPEKTTHNPDLDDLDCADCAVNQVIDDMRKSIDEAFNEV